MFSHFSLEKPLAEKPLDETSDLIFEGVPVTPGPTEREPAMVAEGEKNLPGGSQKEEEKAAFHVWEPRSWLPTPSNHN